MAYRCDICSKKTVSGSSQQHQRGVAGKRWKKRAQLTKRVFVPNLQNVTVEVNNSQLRMKLCTKCIKRIKNYKSIADIKNIKIV